MSSFRRDILFVTKTEEEQVLRVVTFSKINQLSKVDKTVLSHYPDSSFLFSQEENISIFSDISDFVKSLKFDKGDVNLNKLSADMSDIALAELLNFKEQSPNMIISEGFPNGYGWTLKNDCTSSTGLINHVILKRKGLTKFGFVSWWLEKSDSREVIRTHFNQKDITIILGPGLSPEKLFFVQRFNPIEPTTDVENTTLNTRTNRFKLRDPSGEVYWLLTAELDSQEDDLDNWMLLPIYQN